MTADIEVLLDELASSHGLGGIDPDRDQLRDLLAADRDGPLH